MKFAVEVYQEDQVFITIDHQALAFLSERLKDLDDLREVHMHSPAWGGNDLVEIPATPDRFPVHRLSIQLLPETRWPTAGHGVERSRQGDAR